MTGDKCHPYILPIRSCEENELWHESMAEDEKLTSFPVLGFNSQRSSVPKSNEENKKLEAVGYYLQYSPVHAREEVVPVITLICCKK